MESEAYHSPGGLTAVKTTWVGFQQSIRYSKSTSLSGYTADDRLTSDKFMAE